MAVVIRGQVFFTRHPDLDEKKYFVVVSNNKRNQQINSVLCLRLTTTDKSHVPTCVELPYQEGIQGFVVCDDVFVFYSGELQAPVTALSDSTMRKIEQALKLVFAIRD